MRTVIEPAEAIPRQSCYSSLKPAWTCTDSHLHAQLSKKTIKAVQENAKYATLTLYKKY